MNKKPFIPDWIFRQGFSAHQLAIYCYVTMRGDCFEAKSTIAKALRMQPNAFYRALNALINAGWVTKTTQGQGKPVILKCQLQGADMSTKSPCKPKRKVQTRHDREAHNMIMMDNLREMFRHNGLSNDEGAETNVA